MSSTQPTKLIFDTSYIQCILRKNQTEEPIGEQIDEDGSSKSLSHVSEDSLQEIKEPERNEEESKSLKEFSELNVQSNLQTPTPKKKLRFKQGTLDTNWINSTQQFQQFISLTNRTDSSNVESDGITRYSGHESFYVNNYSFSQTESNSSLGNSGKYEAPFIQQQYNTQYLSQFQYQNQISQNLNLVDYKNIYSPYKNADNLYSQQISQSMPQILFQNPHLQQTCVYPEENQKYLTPFQQFQKQQQIIRKGKRRLQPSKYIDSFEINLNNLEKDGRTTLMIKNIPNKYNQQMLLQCLNKNYHDKYDFFYLPIDFINKCNVGYAFINFKEVKHISSFYEQYQNKKWEKFNSEKVQIDFFAINRIQGKNQLISHFEQSTIMNQKDKKFKPVFFLDQIQQLVQKQKNESFKN